MVQIDPKDASKTAQISCRLSGEQELAFIHFLLRNWDIFAWKPSDMPRISREVTEHSLDILPGANLVKQRLHRSNDEKRKAIAEEIAPLLVAGFIKEVFCPKWIANPVLVWKNRTWWMCVDYNNLNKASQRCHTRYHELTRW